MIYQVPLDKIDEMADVSADAFIGANDPIGNFMFQNEPDHLALKTRFFRSLVTSCSPNAVRQAISPVMEAVSIWFPPGMDHTQDVAPDTFDTQDFTDPETIDKMQAIDEVITALTVHIGQEPQWYLHLVAVRPQFREQKNSSLLIIPVLDRASKEKLPSTLITQSMANVHKYEHWGFKVVQKMSVSRSQEKFCFMRKGWDK